MNVNSRQDGWGRRQYEGEDGGGGGEVEAEVSNASLGTNTSLCPPTFFSGGNKNSEISSSFFAVAPDKVTIKGPSDAKVGDSLRFECTTSNSNPPASVTWVVDGRSVNENFTHSVRADSYVMASESESCSM